MDDSWHRIGWIPEGLILVRSSGLTRHLVCLDSVLVAHDVVLRTIIAGPIADASNADTD